MSLITRCPGCGTCFKVVPDQLRLSQGWVRCGQCELVFDAALHLQAAPETALPDAVSAQQTEQEHLVHQELQDEPLTVEPEPVSQPWPEDVPAVSARLIKAAVVDLAAEHDQTLPPAQATPLTFLSEPPSQRRWQQPWARRTICSLSLALMLLLMGQVLVQEREKLLAWQPGWMPIGVAACRVLNCTIAPLKQIESLVIESSSFTVIAGDSYRWDFVLKNTAHVELALPAIELSLTDSLDQVWMRRIFSSQELGAPTLVLAPGAEWAGSLSLRVKIDGQAEQIAGYRMLALYP